MVESESFKRNRNVTHYFIKICTGCKQQKRRKKKEKKIGKNKARHSPKLINHSPTRHSATQERRANKLSISGPTGKKKKKKKKKKEIGLSLLGDTPKHWGNN